MLKSKVYFPCLAIIFALESFRMNQGEVKYLPMGDSYTICTGAAEKESWPVIMTQHLNGTKIKTVLLDNPARNGYSTQNLIDYELPVLKKLKPNFVTLLIGVNDWVREVPAVIFRKNLVFIMDEIQKTIPDKSHFIVITIPDFGVTPQGKFYGNGRDISAGISEFNKIIKEEAKKRNLSVVDIFETSKKMKNDNSLVAGDGLHPSAKEYAIWETMIFPEAVKLLK